MDVNTKRWVLFAYGVASVFVFLTMRQVLMVASDFFRLQEMTLGGVVSAFDVGAVMLGVVAFFVLSKNAKATAFMSEVVVELSKVTWPVRRETLLSTVVVVVLVGIAAIILALFDALWGTLSEKILTF